MTAKRVGGGIWAGFLCFLMATSALAAAAPLPSPGEAVKIVATCGKVQGSVTVRFGDDARKNAQLTVTCVDMMERNHHWGTSRLPGKLADAGLLLRLVDGRTPRDRIERLYFIRPDVHFYIGDDLKRALDAWPKLPAASAHTFEVVLTRNGARIEIEIDARYLGSFEPAPTWETFAVSVAGGAEVRSVTPAPSTETARYVPLDISRTTSQGAVRLDDLRVKMPDDVPMAIVASTKQVDVGLARWLRQAADSTSFYDPYYKRSAWDGIPETIMFSVPRRFYNYLHVLCAVDASDGRSPAMTVRLARYRQAWDGSGATQADTTVVVDPKAPRGCTSMRQVGTVRATDQGAARTLPVYMVEIPLKTGELAGYLDMKEMDWREPPDFFYLEFTREVKPRVSINNGIFEMKPLGPASGVHLLGVAMEKAPVQILVKSSADGNVLYSAPDAALSLELTNPGQRPVRVQCEASIEGFFGPATTLRKSIDAAPGRTRASVPLAGLDAGWYRTMFTCRDAGGRVVWTQPVSFALLPPDTRRAGAESPFGIWWFAGTHYCEGRSDRVLPLVRKMGFRHITPLRRSPKDGITAEGLAKYGITISMMGRMREGGKAKPLAEQANAFFKDWPGTKYAMIFHETGGLSTSIALPPELLGAPAPELAGPQLDRYKQLHEWIVRHAEVLRAAAPGVKIILGNGGTNFNVAWLRARLPRKYWDCIGMEMAVQTFSPESQPTGWNLQSLWIAERMKEIYGYKDLPVTSCYEFDYRATAAGALSLRRQANWYVRDALHCLAYRMPNINIGLIMDCNSSYYTSRWGSTGVCDRAPLMLPKPSYVALATLTQVLDGAAYRRYLDTGSRSLYCLEFKRANTFVYALWTTRGKRALEAAFGGDVRTVERVDMMGAARTQTIHGGRAVLTASASACYLVTNAPLVSVKAGAPEHEPPRLAKPTVIDQMSESARWRIAAKPDEAFANYCAYTPLHQGHFSLARGDEQSIRLTLKPQPDVADLIGRYAVVEPAGGPITIPGKPDVIGVWVRGNSNWGRVYFEILDADGRRWTSNGWEEAPASWDMSDWEADTCINFDGWRFISVRLPAHYASGYYTPDFRNWRCQGDNKRSNRLHYPLTFSRLYVTMREKLVYVTDLVPATSLSVELRDLTAGGSEVD